MRTDKELLTEFVNNLIAESEPLRNFMFASNEDEWFAFENWLSDTHTDCSSASGATKGVIIPEQGDWVIKFPFLADDNEDYCKLEWRNYLFACDEGHGLEQMFAETHFLGNFNFTDGYNEEHIFPVYYQRAVVCDDSAVDDDFYTACLESYMDDNGLTNTEEANEEFYDMYWDADNEEKYRPYLYKNFGELADRFQDFCDRNDIGDLHTGNFGYYDNSIVVVDFSGFGNGHIFSTQGWDSRCIDAA